MTSTQEKGVVPGERTKNYIYNIIESDEPWKGRMLFTGIVIISFNFTVYNRYLYILESREYMKSVEEFEEIDFKGTFNINN